MSRELKERNRDETRLKVAGIVADHKQQVALTTLTLCTMQLFLILGVMALNEDPGAAKVSLLPPRVNSTNITSSFSP